MLCLKALSLLSLTFACLRSLTNPYPGCRLHTRVAASAVQLPRVGPRLHAGAFPASSSCLGGRASCHGRCRECGGAVNGTEGQGGGCGSEGAVVQKKVLAGAVGHDCSWPEVRQGGVVVLVMLKQEQRSGYNRRLCTQHVLACRRPALGQATSCRCCARCCCCCCCCYCFCCPAAVAAKMFAYSHCHPLFILSCLLSCICKISHFKTFKHARCMTTCH